MLRRGAFAAGLAVLLSGCGTSQQTSSLLVAPGKYDIYTCAQIAIRMQDVDTEGKKLEGLMARASQDASGRFVSNIAYEPEYLANRGEMNELRKSAAAKNCNNLPVAATPGKRASDTIIR